MHTAAQVPSPQTLDDWLNLLESRHPQGAAGIELGLERVRAVSRTLGQQQRVPLITVGGTNGKGSTCAMLENILRHAGYRVGLYTSPHLLDYNERVRIDGTSVSDAALCSAFSRVEAARLAAGDIALTYFEAGTLAAWECFAAADVDAIILEVGLGGRLDATNIHDADCAIVTSIDLDHQDYLGSTREAIGFEKAGIYRSGRTAICSDAAPPQSLIDYATAIGADLRLLGRDFGYTNQEMQWQFWSRPPRGEVLQRRSSLAHPGLRGSIQLQNASGVLAVLEAMAERLPVAMQDIRRGLLEVELPGRFQMLPGRPAIVLDIAHNPQAVRNLAANLGAQGQAYHPTTWALFGMMRDKDIAGMIEILKPRIDHWLPCALPGPRAASADELVAALADAGVTGAARVPQPFASVAAAFDYAREKMGENDRIVVFGSFLTVAAAMRILRAARRL
ncbi:bifunctional folylpolyglutamate synthase and dihydrofolate synthase [Sterolibacterium denitrificans]|uniref:Dihydrofolate synthase/folylpolyglutamate synthase n=2 Tax=Sterolibacterium denitrificans TaxID=157592 RepID=A0A656Z8D5_9PROT|nr:bifunctional tetrahydrofolate synthase/dihydrofolate synthase [Sterolibacterium denitrificans]KYC29267.1 folylpolyglutamate synthase [Sterolibacterium denitrificans]SMB30283.1 bifunctional folylpolyglutamate synthase and dihydrofolate synthase [Sterolibacterium denitrificans]